jgi:hypothetical protein
MLLPLGALTAPHGTRSSVNAGLLARARDRISFASISLSTPAIYRDSGRMEVLDQYDEVFRTRKNEDLQLVRRPLPRML